VSIFSRVLLFSCSIFCNSSHHTTSIIPVANQISAPRNVHTVLSVSLKSYTHVPCCFSIQHLAGRWLDSAATPSAADQDVSSLSEVTYSGRDASPCGNGGGGGVGGGSGCGLCLASGIIITSFNI